MQESASSKRENIKYPVCPREEQIKNNQNRASGTSGTVAKDLDVACHQSYGRMEKGFQETTTGNFPTAKDTDLANLHI